jgi:S-adenosylmethionine hydrolase
MQPHGLITLLTDFGLRDGYVAIMKGVILGIAPHARFVDITHEVTPQAIDEASFLLQSAYPYFPRGTVHLAVVDPGVGSDRRPLAVATSEGYFVGPDNGLLAPIVDQARRRRDGPVTVVELTEPRYWLPEISATFHGRDIFAPVAAHLVAGVPIEALGRPLDDIRPSSVEKPRPVSQAIVEARIVHVDRFGNCVTNVTLSDLQAFGLGDTLIVRIGAEHIRGLYRAYSLAPVGVPVALIGSSGHLELAVPNGSATKTLGVTTGDRLLVTPDDPQ